MCAQPRQLADRQLGLLLSENCGRVWRPPCKLVQVPLSLVSTDFDALSGQASGEPCEGNIMHTWQLD